MAVLQTTMILSLLNLSKKDHRYIDKQQQIGLSSVSLPARNADENRPVRIRSSNNNIRYPISSLYYILKFIYQRVFPTKFFTKKRLILHIQATFYQFIPVANYT
jgi:hypothetical protein